MGKKVKGNHSVETKITGSTRLVGLLGDPVHHSISPMMHNAAFRALNLDYVYMAFNTNISNLKSAVEGMKALNVLGFNVTMPNKQRILPYLDELSLEAELVGSVNTVKNQNGKLIGYNTDGLGYIMSLQEEMVEIKDQKFLIVGAGGAATSIALELVRAGAGTITILNRKVEKAQKIITIIRRINDDCQSFAYMFNDENLSVEVRKADVLINCTPLGMVDRIEESIISDSSMLRKELTISDLIYVPKKTKFLKNGELAGCKTLNGTGMILWQGALAFKIWTGKDMPTEILKNILP